MKEEILSFLRNANGYISGEEISKDLKISRAGIWKHIHELRQDGYEIVAVPHLGYSLASIPDKLFSTELSAGLQTKVLGKKIYHFEMLSSTMDIAFDLGMKGALEGTVVVAEGQQKGRGRMGRDWVSPKGKGIYLSVILRPKLLPNESPKLTLLTGVAVSEAIEKNTGLQASIKWPNDLIIKNKKIGGILTEMNAETDIVKFVIIGVGINVNTPESLLPAHATSLKEQLGDKIPRIPLAREILNCIDKDYILFHKEGFKPIIEKWRKFTTTIGQRVRVHFHNEYIDGEALDIDNDGALLLRRDSGLVDKITAGDIVKIR